MFKLTLLVDNANDSGDNDKDDKKIKVIVAERHRKTMMRTLLNLSDNKEFSNKKHFPSASAFIISCST